MIRRAALIVAFVACATAALAAQFGSSQHAIKDDDGDLIANFDIGPDLATRLAGLRGTVTVGNAKGDVTLLQFYDLNCPFCREAAADVDALVRADHNIKLVFVPYPVLSVPSVQGALIELGAASQLSPDKFLELHRRIYAGRGVIDGRRVLAAARDVGLDPEKLAAMSNTESNLSILRASADFGSAAKLAATPAYIINGVAILGHPGLKPLQGVIAAVRACGKVVC